MSKTRVEALTVLSREQSEAVLRLRDQVAATSGTSPLSDDVVGAVRRGDTGNHLLQLEGDQVTGYAHLTSAPHAPVAELVMAPGREPTALLDRIVATSGPGVRVWTRGDDAPLNDALPGLGFTLVRTLLQLRRPLTDPIEEPTWPGGVAVRTFVVGEDEAAWLAVNNAAFAGHPEQSGWTHQEIADRESEPWFDPGGFFLAESAEGLAGFHWTKQHSPDLGEVYVIGVAPQMQGKRLGEALLLQGLRHLRDHGMSSVLLYVEADNAGALALYERLGFTRWSADRAFAR